MTEQKQRRMQESGTLVKQVFCDTYNLYLKYHGRNLGREEFAVLADEMSALVKKHNGERICLQLALATVTQLEEENR